MPEFIHLHSHTQFSLLDGAADIGDMMDKAVKDGMRAVSLTDHGNMFGAFKFVAEAEKRKLKGIVGCEFYMVEDRHRKDFNRAKKEKDERFHQLLLAKNQEGYKNLSKLCSIGFIEGMYSKFPRIDKEVLLKHKEGLIATSCCIGAEIPQAILHGKLNKAEKLVQWWLEHFGEDFYIELQRHRGLENIDELGVSQEDINQQLIKYARKYNIKIIATNDSHYVEEDDYFAHDILLCVNTGQKIAEKDRFKFPSSDFYFKTQAEMSALFADVPEALENTMEIYDKVYMPKLKSDILLPMFQLPKGFNTQAEYLRFLSYQGARAASRYGGVSDEVRTRLDYEIDIISKMGFEGYFLIVQDFINAAREIGVAVGPGRGCLTGDAPVVLADGSTKPLQDVAVGDKVYTQDGSLRVVRNTFRYEIQEDLLRIETYYGEQGGISLTSDHKVLAERQQRPEGYETWARSTQQARKMPEPTGALEWLAASELRVGDWLFVPRVQTALQPTLRVDLGQFSNGQELHHDAEYVYHDVKNVLCNTIAKRKAARRFVELDADWFRILGMFVGDGWIRKSDRPEVSIVFFKDDLADKAFFIDKMRAQGFEVSESVQRNTVQVSVRHKHLYLWFKSMFAQYEYTAHTKHLPELVLAAGEEQILAFLSGYLAADGHESKHKIRFTTVSRRLADQVRFLCWRVGIPASLSSEMRSDKRQAFANRRRAYYINIPKNEKIGSTQAQTNYFYKPVEGGLLVKIRSISPLPYSEERRYVYDIEVAENHNYLTSSFLVHNSAAGSAVAFCLGITNIDPIKYKLLFERFLNPERVSMPDIDIDFDDYGRQDVIDWVVDKYGKNQVAQIITFGTMAARSSIKDVARVLDLPLADSNRIASLVPEKPGTKLAKLFTKPEKELAEDFNADDMTNIQALREIAAKGAGDMEADVIQQARKLEGSVRNTGIHAAGVIIAPKDLTDCIPICTSKDADLWVTQFDGSVVESAGMLKMDFLGLKTLSIIKDAIENIVLRYGEQARIDPDRIPLDDTKTYELFQRGETVALFQFESAGMQKYLKELKPTNIEDLIAMNALYRPGPMDYIPLFVDRKHGREPVEYPHEWLEPILKDTYGIMVYQEQIMQTAQIMADYSLGQADLLRRAMGKKKKEEMEKQSKTFIEGATKKGVPEKQARDIFEIMEKFASYGFNRSHAAAYSFVAFQTAYLKAHYPAEFMASVLTHNKNNTETLNFMLQECRAMGLKVLGPDVNESQMNFTVNKAGAIRFGLAALKNVGEVPVEKLLEARRDGIFTSLGNFAQRISPVVANKKCLESFAYSGAFDSFGIERAAYFAPTEKDSTFIEALNKYSTSFSKQQEESAISLFGAESMSDLVEEPKVPKSYKKWSLIEQLKFEKDIVGIYISGHPLDDYAMEYRRFATPLQELDRFKGKDIAVAGIVTTVNHRVNQRGGGFGIFTIEDYDAHKEIALFGEDYIKYKDHFQPDNVLFIKGKYQEHFRNKGEYEIRVQDVRLLETVGKEKIRGINLRIPIDQLTAPLIALLDQLCQDHAGEQALSVSLQSKQQNITIQYLSFSRKIAIDNLLLRAIERMNLQYELQ